VEKGLGWIGVCGQCGSLGGLEHCSAGSRVCRVCVYYFTGCVFKRQCSKKSGTTARDVFSEILVGQSSPGKFSQPKHCEAM
jgi:hypothetical protein